MGHAVAKNILGANEPFTPIPYFWTDQYDVRVQLAGVIPPDADGRARRGRHRAATSSCRPTRRPASVAGVLAWNAPRLLAQYRRDLRPMPLTLNVTPAISTGSHCGPTSSTAHNPAVVQPTNSSVAVVERDRLAPSASVPSKLRPARRDRRGFGDGERRAGDAAVATVGRRLPRRARPRPRRVVVAAVDRQQRALGVGGMEVQAGDAVAVGLNTMRTPRSSARARTSSSGSVVCTIAM